MLFPLALILTAGIFLLDLATPLGTAVWTLYLIPLLLTLWIPAPWIGMGLAALQTLLILLGAHYAQAGAPLPVVIFNRTVAVAVMWIAAMLIRQRALAYQAFRDSRTQLADILETADDAVISIDQAQHMTVFNRGAERIFGYRAEEVLGQPLDRLLPDRLTAAHRRHVLDFSASPDTSRLMGDRREVSGRRKDGTEFPAEASISKLVLRGTLALTVILRDITPRKAFEHRLAVVHKVTCVLSEATTQQQGVAETLRTLGEGLGWKAGALWLVNDSGDMLRCVEFWHAPAAAVEAFERHTRTLPLPLNVGLPGQVWAKSSPAWIEDVTRDAHFLRAAAAAGSGLRGAFALPVQAGKTTAGVMEFFSDRVQRPDHDLLRLLNGLGRQIGQFLARMRANERLVASEMRLRAIIDNEPDCVKVVGQDGTLLEMNPVGLAMVEAPTADAVLGKPVLNLVHPDDRDIFQALHDRAMNNQRSTAEFRIVGLGGSERWMEMHAVPLHDASGAVHAELSVTRDITERKKAEAAILEKTALLDAFFASSVVPLALMDAQYRFIRVNQAYARACRREETEFRGRTYFELCPSGARTLFDEVVRTKTPLQVAAMPFVFPDRPEWGTTYWDWTLTPIVNAAGETESLVLSLNDVTERHRAEAALLAKTDQLQAITAAMTRFLERGNWREASAALLRAAVAQTQSRYGFIGVATQGPALRILAHEGMGWDRTIDREFYDKALRTYEELGYLEFTGFDNLFGRVMTTGRTVIANDPASDPRSGGLPPGHPPLRNFLGVPILKESEVIGMIGLANRPGGYTEAEQADVAILTQAASVLYDSYRRQQHQTELEEQLRQAQKMEAVGRLAGGIAHDFNNMLTVITGYSHLLLERAAPDAPDRPALEQISQAGAKAAGLTMQLLAFGRRQVLQPCVLNLNHVVAQMATMLQRLIGEDVVLRTDPAPSLGQVKADQGQLEQVIVNLAVNARDAMSRGGHLAITTRNTEIGPTGEAHRVGVAPGSYVVLEVSDDGSGMDEATQARVFEPFFTTKEQGKGTGLGLATVYGIVKQSHGFIRLSSELGRGTTFTIYLPRVTDAAATPRSSGRSDTVVGGTETILLVEDQDAVRTLTHTMLEEYGYRVLAACNSDEAYRASKTYRGDIHLLVTDVVMPEGSGRDIAERLAPDRPDMKVLYVSGYADETIVRHGVLQPDTAFLQKPYTQEALAQKVREVLDTPMPSSS